MQDILISMAFCSSMIFESPHPATLAGTLVIVLAEVLSGLLISQLRVKGAPFVFGGLPGIMDMKTVSFPYGAAELNLLSAALTEMAHYYKLPMFGTAGCGDSKIMDEQNAIEISMSCMFSYLSGANWIHDVGLIGSGSIISPEAMVLADEIIQMIKKTARTIEVNTETLALEIIERIGPKGNFIEEQHTYDNFREAWYPKFFDRELFQKADGQNRDGFRSRICRETQRIIKSHIPKPLSRDVLKDLASMEKKWLAAG